MNVTRILHASVNATGKLDETRRFYTDLLGMKPAPRPEIPGVPGCWFDVGDAEVHIVGAAGSGDVIDPTGNHYCLGVDDLDSAIAELAEAGIPHLRATQGHDPEIVQIWLADPAGNTIELQQDLSFSASDS